MIKEIKPIGLSTSVVIFLGACTLFLIIERVVVPFLHTLGTPKPLLFLVLAFPHILFFFGALIAYKLEGNPLNWPSFISRFRYKGIERKMYLWAVIIIIIDVLLYLAVYKLAFPLIKMIHDWFPTPEVIGEIMSNGETFVGYQLQGNWWLLGLYLSMFFFNVVGEEFLWRGYLFPRQEKQHGKYTWIIHGLLWTSFHLFAPYNAIMVLPGALFMAYISQRTQNNTFFLLSHATLNGIPVVILIMNIIG